MWDDDLKVETLKGLVSERVPYSQIAEKLGTSRSAICAKVHRLGIGKGLIPGRARSEVRQNRDLPDRVEKPWLDALLTRDEAERRSRVDLKAVEDIEIGDCRYVVGDPIGACMCARPAVLGTSWCREHLTRISLSSEVEPRKLVVGQKERELVDA